MNSSSKQIIESLRLRPHPEGGHYREVFRSLHQLNLGDKKEVACTAIYFLLQKEEFSRWHVVTSDEIWNFYEGNPLELMTFDPKLKIFTSLRLGSISDGHEPVAVVPSGVWQAARSLGDFSLAGCTVAPGFEFTKFQFVKDIPDYQTLFGDSLKSAIPYI